MALGRAPVAALGLAAAVVVAALLAPGSLGGPGEPAGDGYTVDVEEPAVAVIASDSAPDDDANNGSATSVKTGAIGESPLSSTPAPVQDALEPNPPSLLAEAGSDAPSGTGGYRRLAETMAVALHTGKSGEQPPYPDPRAGPEQMASAGERAMATAEERLELSAAARREVQRRLAMAKFDPQHFDGIFGPATRAALGRWQEAAGIPATGYLDGAALALLREQTAEDYRVMQAASKAKARLQEVRMVLASPVPPRSPLRANRCSRTREGAIVYGRSVRCDFRGLRQSISRLFG